LGISKNLLGWSSCGVNEAQRGLAVRADAIVLIANDDVPAVSAQLDDSEELATVVEVLEAARSRQSVLSRAHGRRFQPYAALNRRAISFRTSSRYAATAS